MNQKTTAVLLAQLRKENNYTQSQLADKLGVTFQAVSKWERGENLPDALLLQELGKLYHVTVDELLNGKLIIKENKQHKKLKNILFIIAISLIIMSPISIFIFGYDRWNIYVPIIIGITAISIGMILYATMNPTKLNQSAKTPKQQRREEIIYVIAAGIFLFLGLVYNLFQIAWIIFVFAYALTLIIYKEDE